MGKYKIVVLSNLKDALKTTLKNAIRLAQTVDGEIEVFNIQKPAEVVKKENQLSAMRVISAERTATNKKMRAIIDPIAKEFGLKIKYSFVFGNVKDEISKYIDYKNPDMVILAKRKSKFFNALGDRITEFVLNTYKGEIMIAADTNTLEPNQEIALGTLDDIGSFSNPELMEQLLQQTEKPLKSFKFIKSTGKPKKSQMPQTQKTIEYVFDHNPSALEKLPKYVSKNNIDLLLINWAKKENTHSSGLISSDINGIIDKLNIPLMFMGERNSV